MPLGLQVFDASGNVIVDTSTRLGRILGVTNTNTSTGSLVNSNFSTGTPFWYAIPLLRNDVHFGPLITVSGNTLSWDYQGRTFVNHRIVYGVY